MGSTANRLPTVCAPVEPSTNEKGVARGPCGSTASSTPSWSLDAEHREPAAELVDRAEALHLDDLVAGHSNELQALGDVGEDRAVAVGTSGCAGRCRVRPDPTAMLQEERSVVSVRGDWCPERERAEVLEEVVELVERPLAVFPAPIALGERLRRERRQPQQVVGPVTDHVDGEVVAGEHVEVGTHTVADFEAVPLGFAVTTTSASRRCSSARPAALRTPRGSRSGRTARTSDRARTR